MKLIVGISSGIVLWLLVRYQKYRQLKQKVQSLMDQRVIDVCEIDKHKNTNQDNVQFVRFKFAPNQATQSYKMPLHSNNRTFIYPSHHIFLNSFNEQMTNKSSPITICDVDNQNTKTINKVLVFDDQVLDYSYKITSLQKLGFFTNVYAMFALFAESIFKFCFALPFGIGRNTLSIYGPHTADLTATVTLKPDICLVMFCQINSDSLQPYVVSNSKNAIIERICNSLEVEFIKLCIFGFVLLAPLAYFGYTELKRTLKKPIPAVNGYEILKIDDIGDAETCIICKTQPRNTLFSQCLHLVICSSCFQEYNKMECPICRKVSPEVKFVFSTES